MIQIAILGYGTVGSGVVEVLNTNYESICQKAGQEIQIKYVLDLRDFPGTPVEKLITKNIEEILNDDEVKIVVEVMGGTNPAYDFVKRALLKGKHVVTSNKALVASYGPELLDIAREKSVNFLFEASVGGGIPIIRPLNKSLTADEIYEISGILNGTTNFILSRMSQFGQSFDEALKEAQELGYAEADPSADVDGHDSCRKIAILSSLSYGMHVNFEEIYTEGIRHIRRKDIEYAKSMGYQIKLMATSKRINNRAYAMVAPMMIPEIHPLSGVHNVYNAIFIKGNVIGEVMFYGSGAGKLPTASAVMADIVDTVLHINKNIITHWYSKEMELLSLDEVPAQYFIAVAGHNMQDLIYKYFGEVTYIHDEEETVFITNRSTEGKLKEAVAKMTENDQTSVLSLIRIEKV